MKYEDLNEGTNDQAVLEHLCLRVGHLIGKQKIKDLLRGWNDPDMRRVAGDFINYVHRETMVRWSELYDYEYQIISKAYGEIINEFLEKHERAVQKGGSAP